MRSELKGAARKELLHCPPCMSSAGCPSLSYSAFRPTLHMRAATRLLSKLPVYTMISTRAPHEVERQSRTAPAISAELFQSPLPVRGATAGYGSYRGAYVISIHAPRAGSDSNIAQISDDRAAILRHGFQTISPPTAEKSLSANKKLFLMPFSAREPPGFLCLPQVRVRRQVRKSMCRSHQLRAWRRYASPCPRMRSRSHKSAGCPAPYR